MASEDLDALAAAELIQEAKRGSERAKEMGAMGWRKSPLPPANKVFINNTVLNIVSDSKRRQRKRETVINRPVFSNSRHSSSYRGHRREYIRSPMSSHNQHRSRNHSKYSDFRPIVSRYIPNRKEPVTAYLKKQSQKKKEEEMHQRKHKIK